MAAHLAAKVAVKAATSKTGQKIILGLIIAMIGLPILMMTLVLSGFAALFPSMVDQSMPKAAPHGLQVIPSCAVADVEAALDEHTPTDDTTPGGTDSDESIAVLAGLTPTQLAGIATVINYGIDQQVPARGIEIAATAALVTTTHDLGEATPTPTHRAEDILDPDDTTDVLAAFKVRLYDALASIEDWQDHDPQSIAVNLLHDEHVAAGSHYGDSVEDDWQTGVNIVAVLINRDACPDVAYPLDPPYNVTDDYGPRIQPMPGVSVWHPAYDLAQPCGNPVYAIADGDVVESGRLYLSIKNKTGYTVSYLHTEKDLRLVDLDDHVKAGDQIAVVGDVYPATGCHLDLRIHPDLHPTDPDIANLEKSRDAGGPAGWVDPADFFDLYTDDGLCPAEWCHHLQG